MGKYFAIALAFFISFAAGGYLVGRKTVTSEAYLLANLANSSHVRIAGESLILEISNSKSEPIWTLNLMNNSAYFANTKYALRSMEGTSLSAESNLMLTFASGGAASVTASTLYKNVLEANKSKDWRFFVASTLGGVSGYLSGYYLAILLAKPTQEEALAILRKRDTIEKLKKYVFISMLESRGLPDFRDLPYKSDTPLPCEKELGKNQPATIEDLQCLAESVADSAEMQQMKLVYNLMAGVQEDLSDDSRRLNNDAFLAFFLGSHQFNKTPARTAPVAASK